MVKIFVCSALMATASAVAADWPQWLGPKRDGHAGAGEKLMDKLPAELTPAWKISIGTGFSSPVVAGKRLVYVDGMENQEVAHCIDIERGKELWAKPFAAMYSDEWGSGTRATPIIDGKRAYAQSCNGEFRCFDLESGNLVWGTSFEKDFGVRFLGSKAKEGTAARRGNNGSPIIDGDMIFVPVGATDGASVVAFDKETGKVLWKNGRDEAAYSSLVVADLAGVRHVLAFTADSLVGHRREDGKILWRIPVVTGAKRNTMTPVIVGDSIIVNTYTGGMTSFLVSKKGEEFTAEGAWTNKNTKINLATPVLLGGFLYSHGPIKNFVCVDPSNGEVKWTQNGFGEHFSGTIVVGDKLLVLTDAGELVVIKPSADRYQEIARIQVCGKNWNSPAWADGKLYIRDQRELACYPIGQASR